MLILPLLGTGQRLQAQETAPSPYPRWFKAPPLSDGTLWAVGYAPAYTDLETGMREAKMDAYESLRRARQVIVVGERLYEATPGREGAFRGEHFVERGLPDTLQSITYIDSVNTAGMTMVLAAWPAEEPGSLSVSRAPRQTSFSKAPPSWVSDPDSLTESNGPSTPGERTVGIAPRYYNLENSWQAAERTARRKLAFEAATRVRSLNKLTEDWRNSVQSITTAVHLRHVQVQSRWANETHCYVLMEGTVVDVIFEDE